MKKSNCRFVKRQHRFIIGVEDLNTLLLGLVAITRKGIVDIKYGVYRISGTEITVFVGVNLNYVEADLLRCKLKSEDVDYSLELV